jgi:hypothetical protein
MISDGTTGMTSRCSTVPCSRSRIGAAAVRMTVSSVIWLMTCVIAENHEVLRFGLKAARTTRLVGAPFESALPEMNRWISVAMALRRELAPLPAWATAVASTLIWSPILRWARTSASKFGGISTTNRSLPWSINESMSEAVICTGGWKVGEGPVPMTQAMVFSAEDGCDVGEDGGAPVSPDCGSRGNAFNGRFKGVRLAIADAAENVDHLVSPEDAIRIAMARQ